MGLGSSKAASGWVGGWVDVGWKIASGEHGGESGERCNGAECGVKCNGVQRCNGVRMCNGRFVNDGIFIIVIANCFTILNIIKYLRLFHINETLISSTRRINY